VQNGAWTKCHHCNLSLRRARSACPDIGVAARSLCCVRPLLGPEDSFRPTSDERRGGAPQGSCVSDLSRFVVQMGPHEVASLATRGACGSIGHTLARCASALGACGILAGPRGAGMDAFLERGAEAHASFRASGDRLRGGPGNCSGSGFSSSLRCGVAARAGTIAGIAAVASKSRGCSWRHGESRGRGRGSPDAQDRWISSSTRCCVAKPGQSPGHLPTRASKPDRADEIPYA